MKKLSVLVFLGVLFFTVSFAQAGGIIDGLSVSSEYAVYNKYVWRGFELDSDPVAQTGLSAGYKFLTVGVWNSQDITYDDAVNSAEFDYAFDITKAFGEISLSLGHTYYTFPAADLSSKELYLGISYAALLSPNLVWYHDYGKEKDGGGDGDYISLDLSYSIPVTEESVSLDLSGNAGYNNGLFIAGNGGDFGLGASLTVNVNEGLVFASKVSYAVPFGDLADENDGNQEDSLFTGVSVGYEF